MKKHKLKKTDKNGRESIHEGTLESLIEYFRYTLDTGYSYNRNINTHPKNITSLINNLRKSYIEKEKGLYQRTRIELIN